MSLREILLPWGSQPQEAVGIDWSNPITRGLIDWGTPVEPNGISGVNSPTVVARRDGIAHKGNGSSSYFFKSVPPLPIVYEATVLAIVHGAATAEHRAYSLGSSLSATPIISIGAITAANAGFYCRLPGGGYTPTAVTGFEDAAPHLIIGIAFATGTEVWVDGVLSGTSAVATDGSIYQLDRIGVGALVRSTPASYSATGVLLRAAWNRRLSSAEIADISYNPWQLFEPRRIYTPGAVTGSAPTLSAATFASLTSTTVRPRVTVTF